MFLWLGTGLIDPQTDHLSHPDFPFSPIIGVLKLLPVKACLLELRNVLLNQCHLFLSNASFITMCHMAVSILSAIIQLAPQLPAVLCLANPSACTLAHLLPLHGNRNILKLMHSSS